MTFGAFGDLHVVDVKTGRVRWTRNLSRDFPSQAEMKWGTCSTPLVVDELVIVNPGAKDASLVALRLQDGTVAWKTPGRAASHSSFIAAVLGGRRQIVGYDAGTLGGWDPCDGKRIWTLGPTSPRDFNVPTPLVADNRLFVVGENTKARLFELDAKGVPKNSPSATYEELAPDSHSPVAVGSRVFGVWNSLHCLRLDKRLQKAWEGEDPVFRNYASIIHDDRNLLVTSTEGELLLVDGTAASFRVMSRLKLFEDDHAVYSHPALSEGRLYVRGTEKLIALSLNER